MIRKLNVSCLSRIYIRKRIENIIKQINKLAMRDKRYSSRTDIK